MTNKYPNDVFLMHTETGEVQTANEWLMDYEEMDPELWFGCPIDEITIHMMDNCLDYAKLHTVVYVNGDWHAV